MNTPTVYKHSYTDHESGETINVYWIVTDDNRTVYTDSLGTPLPDRIQKKESP